MIVGKQNTPAFGAVFVKFPPQGLGAVNITINKVINESGMNYEATKALRGSESCVMKFNKLGDQNIHVERDPDDKLFADLLKNTGLDVWV